MLAELREHVPQTVVTVQASFEDLLLTPAYDLVFAAASLHWTEPSHRWMRVAAMLAPNGTFASFGGQMRLADSGVEQAVRTRSARHGSATTCSFATICAGIPPRVTSTPGSNSRRPPSGPMTGSPTPMPRPRSFSRSSTQPVAISSPAELRCAVRRRVLGIARRCSTSERSDSFDPDT